MKRTNKIAHCFLCLAFGALTATPISAQILNSGFETAGATSATATNWTVTQAAGGPVYAIRTNNNPHSGTFNFEVRLASVGAGPVVGFAQSGIPVAGGTTYPFTFYASALTGSAGYNAQWKILWNNGGDTGFRSFTPGNNTYALISNSVTAPQAATSATISFYCAGAALPSQSATILLDDLCLTATNGNDGGTTNSPFTLAIWPAARISWFASNSITYQVQWASSSNATNWNNWGAAIIGNGSTNNVVDVSGPPHNFFRVLSIR